MLTAVPTPWQVAAHLQEAQAHFMDGTNFDLEVPLQVRCCCLPSRIPQQTYKVERLCSRAWQFVILCSSDWHRRYSIKRFIWSIVG